MNIDISTLRSGIVPSINVNLDVDIGDDLLKSNNIVDVRDIKVNGIISNDYDGYYLDLKLTGILVLPCSVTLKPVDYFIDIKIEGNSNELLEEMNIFDKNNENILDIFPIIWENILMEIPIRVVSEGAEPIMEGNGWKVITDDEKRGNTPFDKLNELL